MSEFTKDYYDNAELKGLSDKEHVLKFSGMYLGANEMLEYNELVYDAVLQKMQSKTISYVAAIMTQIKEIYDNCADEYNRCKGEMGDTIKINVIPTPNGHKFVVTDNARGFPSEDVMLKAFTQLRTGSNFDNKAETSKAGTYGLGATLVNITSVWFKVVSINHLGERTTLICTDNMTNIDIKTDKAPASAVRGTTVEYIPDYKLFGISDLQPENDPHIDVLYTRLMNISIAYPGMKIIFNGKTIKANTFKDYVKHFSDTSAILIDSDRIMVAVYPTEGYEFTHIVNGLLASEGGNLNDYIINGVVTKFTERLQKSYKKLTNTAIKSKLGIISILRDVKGLKYTSQTKEKISNNYTSTDLPLLPFVDFAEQLNKNKYIRDGIVELYRIQQEMEKRKALSGVKKVTKERVQGHIKAIQSMDSLNISEGLSPQGLLMGVLDRKYNGFYGLTGLFTNVQKANNQQIAKNKVIQDLVNILDIDMVKHNVDQITYKNVIISSDSDSAGVLIAGLLITFFNKYAPDFIKQGRLKRNVLPLMVAFDKKGEVVEAFKYFRDFVEWKKNNDESKYEIRYFKGLSSFDPSLIKKLFLRYGENHFLETYIHNGDSTNDLINNWMDTDTVSWRKEQLLSAPELDIGIA